jgi:sulfate transport system substrate-binding protein
VATEYLKYLYSDEGQEIAAKNFYRPRNEGIAKKYAANFTQLKLVTLNEEFGSWANAQKTHFADGGVFDQIFQPQN